MKKIYKILIQMSMILVLCTISFFIGKACRTKDFDVGEINSIRTKLEFQEKRNEELLQHLSNYEKIIMDLESDNDNLNSKIQSIINYTNEMQQNLNEINTSSTLDYIKILKRNNEIIQKYFEKMEMLNDE